MFYFRNIHEEIDHTDSHDGYGTGLSHFVAAESHNQWEYRMLELP